MIFSRKEYMPKKMHGEEIYRIVNAEHLTPDELRKNEALDKYCFEISVEFKSKVNVPYKAVHIPRDDEKSHILLIGGPENFENDFRVVQEIIAKTTGGIIDTDSDVVDRGLSTGLGRMGDLVCNDIRLETWLKQRDVADFVEGYIKAGLWDVAINLARFHDVPVSAYKKSGLPPDMLKVIDLAMYGSP